MPTENWGLLMKIASHTSFQVDKEKIYFYLVAEKIEELVMRKIPQIVQAESASFIVPFVSRFSASLRNTSTSPLLTLP